VVTHEQKRGQLHGMLTDVIGTWAADMLIDPLPPLAWSDLSTKTDTAMLGADMNALTAMLRSEMAGMRVEMANGTSKLVFTTMAMWIATLGTVGGLSAALAH
jgi:hypothetical protein